MAIQWISADSLQTYLVICDGEIYEATYKGGCWHTDRTFDDDATHWAYINWPDNCFNNG